MTVQITRTQIVVPRRRAEILTRQRLNDLLISLLDYRLIVVTAPAGYGKTSLLVDFVSQTELPVCWYSLNTLDRDPQRFVAHFIASIGQVFPSFGQTSLAILDSSTSGSLELEALLPAVVNEIDERISEHFVLVIDDYHLVNGVPKIDQFLSRFIQLCGENVHIAVLTRTLPNIPDLGKMVANSLVGGISFEELQFEPQEIQELVFQNNRVLLSRQAAEEMARESEGWITGLLLSSQSAIQGTTDRLRTARVSGVGLYEYLAEEALGQQPEDIRIFLMRTSFLEEFDASLCGEVFGPGSDWSSIIFSILQANLFILPVGDDGRWVRYHHLFRDFLQTRYSRECPEERTSLLNRLADVYASRGEWEKGYSTIQKTEDLASIAEYIENAGSFMITNVRLEALKEWIDGLPWSTIAAHPALLSLRGTINLMQGQAASGLELLDRAVAALEKGPDAFQLASALRRRSVALRLLGRYDESIRDASRVLEMSAGDISLFPQKADALRVMGASLYQLGRLNEALDKWKESLAAFETLGDRQNQTTVQMEVGVALMDSGSYRQALRYYLPASEYLRETQNYGRLANLLYNLGVLYSLLGDPLQSGIVFAEALSYTRSNGYHRIEAYVLSGLGDLYSTIDVPESAIEAFRAALDVLQRVDDRFLSFYVPSVLSVQERLLGQVDSAKIHLNRSWEIVAGSKSPLDLAYWRRSAGHLALLDEDWALAESHLTQAASVFDSSGQNVEASGIQMTLAGVYFRSGEQEKAHAALQSAFNTAALLDSNTVLISSGRQFRDLLDQAAHDHQVGKLSRRLIADIEKFEKELPSIRKRLRPHVAAMPLKPPRLVIHTFGQQEVELDGEVVTHPEWQYQKRVRDMFYYLLVYPQGATMDELALIFCPEKSHANARLLIKNTIYRLRCALGSDVIAYNDARYRFDYSLDYEYDAEVLQESFQNGRLASKEEDKIAAFTTVMNIYCGIFLPEIDGSWVIPERHRLWNMVVESAVSLARIYLDGGLPERTLSITSKILSFDVTLEEAHRLAMLAYSLRGENTLIKRQYETLKRALTEIGLKPSLETDKIYSRFV